MYHQQYFLKNKKIVFITVILIITLTLLLLSACDPYAKYRYPTAKEAMEAEGYTVKQEYGEVELNGVICYLFDTSDYGNSHVSCILSKNENGYSYVDVFAKEGESLSSYFDIGIVQWIMYYKKFNKYILDINLFRYETKPIVSDSLGNEPAIIAINSSRSTAYFVLDKIPKDYKICVDGIWYPLPQQEYEMHWELPPQ